MARRMKNPKLEFLNSNEQDEYFKCTNEIELIKRDIDRYKDASEDLLMRFKQLQKLIGEFDQNFGQYRFLELLNEPGNNNSNFQSFLIENVFIEIWNVYGLQYNKLERWTG